MDLQYYRLKHKRSKQALLISAITIFIFLIIRLLTHTTEHLDSFGIGDSYGYLLASDWINSGKYFIPSRDPATAIELTRRPIIYPLFLSLLGGHNHVYFILFIQSIIGIGCFYLIILYYEKIGGSKPSLLILCAILTPSYILFMHIIMSEILIIPLVLIMALLLLKKITKRSFIIIQLILSILPLIRPIFFPFTLVNIVITLFTLKQFKLSFKLICVIPLFISFSNMKYNEYRTGFFHFTSIENINLLQYNLKSFKEHELGNEKGDIWVDSVLIQSEKFPTYAEQNKYIANVCRTEIKRNLVKYTLFHLTCCTKAFIDPSRYDILLFFKRGAPAHGSVFQSYNDGGFVHAIFQSLDWLIGDTIHSPNKGFLMANIYILLSFTFQIIKWFFIFKYLIFYFKTKNIQWSYPTIFTIIFIAYNILITGPVASPRYLIPIDFYIFCATALGIELGRKDKNKRKELTKIQKGIAN